METKICNKMLIPLSDCDNNGKLSVPRMFEIFMDVATEHAVKLSISAKDLGNDLFWLAVRTKVRVSRRPEMSQEVTVTTWPQMPVRVRTNRHYTISDADGVMISGKTEWAVINTQTGRLQRLTDIFPSGFEFGDEVAIEEPYARVSDDFTDAEIVGEYTVKSTDIDVGQHMNNSAYVRAFFSLFSCKELEENEFTEFDIAYKAQSYEGETLTVKCREVDGAYEYAMIKPDSTVATTIRAVRG